MQPHCVTCWWHHFYCLSIFLDQVMFRPVNFQSRAVSYTSYIALRLMDHSYEGIATALDVAYLYSIIIFPMPIKEQDDVLREVRVDGVNQKAFLLFGGAAHYLHFNGFSLVKCMSNLWRWPYHDVHTFKSNINAFQSM